MAGEEPTAGIIALVTPDGVARQVADGIEFPNGMVVTPDNSTLIVSESFAGRLTAFDIAADGSLSNRRVWADGWARTASVWMPTARSGRSRPTPVPIRGSTTPEGECLRVREGGEVLQRIGSTAPASPACSVAPMAARCSCWPPSGGASRMSTTPATGTGRSHHGRTGGRCRLAVTDRPLEQPST